MLLDQARLLAAFWIRPRKAPGEALDHASLAVAIAIAVITALILQAPITIRTHRYQQQWDQLLEKQGNRPLAPAEEKQFRGTGWAGFQARYGQHPTLLTLAGANFAGNALRGLFFNVAVMVPIALALLSLIEGRGRTLFNVQNHFAGMLSCALYAWSAAFIPSMLFQAVAPSFTLLSQLYFFALAILSLRTVMGSPRIWPATVSILAGIFVASLVSSLTQYLGGVTYLAILALYYFGGNLRSTFGDLGGMLGRQQSFRRHLEALTLNERDADAHYQLGLLYSERRDWQNAASRFRRATEIDPQDPDYSLALGRTLRELGQLDAAVTALKHAAANNDQAGSNEVWRELGAAYLAQHKPALAVTALHKYVARREYDPEGPLLLGQALRALGQTDAARKCFDNALRAAGIMPHHRRGEARHWASKAKQELRSLS